MATKGHGLDLIISTTKLTPDEVLLNFKQHLHECYFCFRHFYVFFYCSAAGKEEK